jgi:hypothetical protein
MKNLAIGILLLTTVVFAGLYLQQSHYATDARKRSDDLEQKLQEASKIVADEQRRTASLREQLRGAESEVIVKAAALAQAQAVAGSSAPAQSTSAGTPSMAAAGATNASGGSPLASLLKSKAMQDMLKSPEMRDMIKASQKAAIGTMYERNYSKIVADLHLSPEQSASLKDLIMNKQLAGADIGLSLLGGDMDAAKRAELVQQVKTQSDAYDAQIKQLLGDDNYAQFQAYEKTQTERTMVSSLKDQLGTGPTALAPDQEQQLVSALSQERQNFKFTTDLSDQSKFNGDFASFLSEEKVDQFTQELDRLNQQYVTRAQGILSADQLGTFKKGLDNQFQMQKLSLKMASQLLAPKSGGQQP